MGTAKACSDTGPKVTLDSPPNALDIWETEMANLARDEYLQSMRLMAWERAKGELRSIGNAAYTAGDKRCEENMERYLALMKEFIEVVDGDGLLES